MLHHNPYFSEDSFSKITKLLSWSIDTLISIGSYDGSNRDIQIKAGKELREVRWIIITIIDHIFDYAPFQWYIAEDEIADYQKFRTWFIQHPEVAINNAISYANNNFAVLSTVTRYVLKRYWETQRDLESEKLLIETLQEIHSNLDKFTDLLRKPKQINDSSKPTQDEIKQLVNDLQHIANNTWNLPTHIIPGGPERISSIIENFLYPLYLAWRVYQYGWYNEFVDERNPMLFYRQFSLHADEETNKLINVLENHSPFPGPMTQNLLKVYRHLLTQDWRSCI